MAAKRIGVNRYLRVATDFDIDRKSSTNNCEKGSNPVDKFTRWLERTGMGTIAKRIGVSRQILSQWKQRKSLPRPRYALLLIRMSKGAVTFEDVYKPVALRTLRKKKSQR